MTDFLQNIFSGANWLFNYGWVVALLVGFWWLAEIVKQRRSYEKRLSEELAQYGLRYLSEKAPPLFSTGPFPKVEKPRLLRRSARIMGMSGQWMAYREVRFLDAQGQTHSAWVKLRHEAFQVTEITWRPALTEFAPKGQLRDLRPMNPYE